MEPEAHRGYKASIGLGVEAVKLWVQEAKAGGSLVQG